MITTINHIFREGIKPGRPDDSSNTATSYSSELPERLFSEGPDTNTDLIKDGKILNSGALDGLRVSRFTDGTVELVAHFKAGVLDGFVGEWYTGIFPYCRQPKTYRFYKAGKLDGRCRIYYENGTLKSSGFYTTGAKNGAFETWYENGQLKSSCKFKDDKLDGVSVWYFPTGQLKTKCTYKNGKREGFLETWYEGQDRDWLINSQLRYRESYKNDEVDGLCETWYENGNLKSKKVYKVGKVVNYTL